MITKFSKLVITDLQSMLTLLKTEGFVETVKHLNSRDAPGIVQFAKYGFCGVAALIVQLLIFKWLTHGRFPAHEYLGIEGLTKETMERNSIIANFIGFPFSTLVAYFLNVLWVFTPGRHSKLKEFALFAGIGLFASAVGIFGGPALISQGLNPWIAQGGFVVTSALVNYACRKFLIFLK